MNKIQQISKNILTDRLKLELGVALKAEVDYQTLRAMKLQLRQERLQQLAQAEATYLAESRIKAA